MKKSQYNFLFDYAESKKILYNSFSGNIIVLSCKNSENYMNNSYEDKNFETFLHNKGFLIKESVDETELILDMHEKEKIQTDRLTLIIAPTLDCNFSCAYCFEDNQDLVMERSAEEQIVHLVAALTPKISVLEVIWYGGEPLLNVETVIHLSQSLISLCDETGIRYYSLMITNGYLLDHDLAAKLSVCRIYSYQITVDGNEPVHNSRRMLKGGEGTFNKIIANLQENSDLIFSIRTNIDRENMQSFHELIHMIESLNLKNVTVDIAKVGCDSHDSFSNKEFGNFLLDALRSSTDKTFKNFHLPSLKKVYCGFETRGSIIIDPRGDMYKCWASIGCREKSYANIFDVNSIVVPVPGSQRKGLDSRCEKCRYLPICMGGCANEAIHTEYDCTCFKYILKDFVVEYVKKYSEFVK